VLSLRRSRASLGHPHAMNDLAISYLDGPDRDLHRADELMLRAAQLVTPTRSAHEEQGLCGYVSAGHQLPRDGDEARAETCRWPHKGVGCTFRRQPVGKGDATRRADLRACGTRVDQAARRRGPTSPSSTVDLAGPQETTVADPLLRDSRGGKRWRHLS
jgi:hypothetical protein